MRKPLVAVSALSAVIALTMSGCGGSGSSAPGSDSSPTPTSTCSAQSSTAVISLSEADRGAHICMAVGQKLRVILKSDPDNLWQQPVALGDAIAPTADGTLALVRGASGAAFVAAHPGDAVVSSSRRACPSASPGAAACQAVETFQATVTVR